jgi:hypothetical protein
MFEGTEMEPLVIESTSPPSALTDSRPVTVTDTDNNTSPQANEDDGLVSTDDYENQKYKQQTWKQKWAISTAVTLLLVLALVFIFVVVFNYNDSYPPGVIANPPCYTPFGTVLGQDANKVIGYSNCNELTVSSIPNYIYPNGTNANDDSDGGVYSGMQWQCVEYSRRWLILSKQVTYESIDYAYQIWDLTEVVNITDNLTKHPFTSHGSGTSLTPPEVGCLLIYNSTDYLEPTGHVSVIVGVEENMILIGEQNWSNDHWLGASYARNLTLSLSSGGQYAVEDEYVIGWKCVDGN